MKKLISHFWYSRTQRNGILFLLILIIASQIAYFTFDFKPNSIDDPQSIQSVRAELDSLYKASNKEVKSKNYPFNPNYITDFKGYQLGMSVKEIDRLLNYRKEGKFINSVSEFQKVTQVSDSLLNAISIYFKFPEWVMNKQKSKQKKIFYNPVQESKDQISTTDLNKATASDFNSLQTVNEFLANRIIKYRNKIQGFYFEDQLQEIWGIKQKQIDEILKTFTIQSKPLINKVNINTASFKEVLSIPYIDYDLCKKLFEYRDEVAELQSISEIKNVEGFPLNKYDRIVLYLLAE